MAYRDKSVFISLDDAIEHITLNNVGFDEFNALTEFRVAAWEGAIIATGDHGDGRENIPADEWRRGAFGLQLKVSNPSPFHPWKNMLVAKVQNGELRHWRDVEVIRNDVSRLWPQKRSNASIEPEIKKYLISYVMCVTPRPTEDEARETCSSHFGGKFIDSACTSAFRSLDSGLKRARGQHGPRKIPK